MNDLVYFIDWNIITLTRYNNACEERGTVNITSEFKRIIIIIIIGIWYFKIFKHKTITQATITTKKILKECMGTSFAANSSWFH
jgi:hypothetical protein